MGLYNSSRTFTASQDFVPFAIRKIKDAFGQRHFKLNVKSESLDRTVIEVQRGGIIQQAIGMRAGLEITFTREGDEIEVEARACLIENQLVGPAIIFYAIPKARIPVAIIDGLSLLYHLGLDEDALDVVSEAFAEFSGIAPEYCPHCGQRVYGDHKCSAEYAYATE